MNGRRNHESRERRDTPSAAEVRNLPAGPYFRGLSFANQNTLFTPSRGIGSRFNRWTSVVVYGKKKLTSCLPIVESNSTYASRFIRLDALLPSGNCSSCNRDSQRVPFRN